MPTRTYAELRDEYGKANERLSALYKDQNLAERTVIPKPVIGEEEWSALGEDEQHKLNAFESTYDNLRHMLRDKATEENSEFKAIQNNLAIMEALFRERSTRFFSVKQKAFAAAADKALELQETLNTCIDQYFLDGDKDALLKNCQAHMDQFVEEVKEGHDSSIELTRSVTLFVNECFKWFEHFSANIKAMKFSLSDEERAEVKAELDESFKTTRSLAQKITDSMYAFFKQEPETGAEADKQVDKKNEPPTTGTGS